MSIDDQNAILTQRFNEIGLPLACIEYPEQFKKFFEESFILLVEHRDDAENTTTVSLLSPDSHTHVSEMTKPEE